MEKTVDLATFIERYNLYGQEKLINAILGLLLPKDGVIVRLDFYELAYQKMVTPIEAEGLLRSLQVVLPSFYDYERESQYVLKIFTIERNRRINDLTELQKIAFDMATSKNYQLVHMACEQMQPDEQKQFLEFLQYMKIEGK